MRPKLLGLITISVLALAGCSSPEPPAPQPSETSTPSASAEDAVQKSNEDSALFERSLEFRWQGEQPYPEAELVEAAEDACEQLRDGARTDIVELELAGISAENEQAISAAAQDAYCRDTMPSGMSDEERPKRIDPTNP